MTIKSLRRLLGGCTIFSGALLNHLRVYPWLLLMLWISSYVAADEKVMPVIQFSIKPRLCVLTAKEEVCRDELEVKWAAEDERSLCLYQSGEPLPLRCWEDQKQGAYQFSITASTSVDFHLREVDGAQALGSEVFEVVYDQKKYRKQRRNPWSFF
jgi:hypothetical protein